MPLDNNNIRVIVKGETSAPTGKIIRQEAGGIILGFTPEISNQANAQNPENISGMPNSQTPQTIAQTTESQPNVPSPKPDVLFPNPEILIEGKPAPPAGAMQPVAPTPSFLPRAVAPPVGDIAVSNINSTPKFIDLGTQIRVPRLVLRDAPVREVLGLLARSAGLNVIFTDTGAEEEGDEGPQGSDTISLDLENEPVQDVFNSVLMVSNLKANRRGSTIFVGPQLPTAARNIITRTLRLNQVQSANAAAFLASQGAGVQQLFTPREQVVDPETQRIVREIEGPTELVPLTVELPEGQEAIPLLLNGLAVSNDDRLNSITLVGEPRQIEIATAFLTQLDARRRQVAVNVKIVDVNLSNMENYTSSFSFGVNDTYVIQDQGRAIVRFGDTRPPNRVESAASVFSAPVIAFPTPAGATLEPFFDQANGPFSDFSTPNRIFGFRTDNLQQDSNNVIPNVDANFSGSEAIRGVFARPNFGTFANPFQPGVTDITISPDQPTEFEIALPGLFQFPDGFLATLEAEITNGNAKILTDPTLVVQEGQEATVKLVEEVITNFETDVQTSTAGTTTTVTAEIEEAGLTLTVNVDRIDDNGFITLSASPIITAPVETVPFDFGNVGNNFITLLGTRELSSGLIRLRDGQTLILSGIIQDTERTVINKVPILGDIPILGALFRRTEQTNDRTEVIVLVTPQIIDDSHSSGWGYNYTPGRDAGEMLRKRGMTVPIQP
ncbi:MAG: pilus assembly protein [Moorea sp. SIO2B7]|nr:pilus assembly protein [Moorena sp. SIO2B7]